MISVLLIADVRLYREGLAALIRADGRVRVVASSGGSELAPASAVADVLVVDTAAAGSAEAARRIAHATALPIVAIGIPDGDEHVVAFAEAGVLGFVERDAQLDDLVEGVRCAARGEASCPPRIQTTLLNRLSALADRRANRSEMSSLTRRERQIVQLIAEGLSNKEIAQRLSIEITTVKNHVHNILEKLQVNRRGDAVARLSVVEGTDAGIGGSPLRARAG